ncbi:long-chain fatty acid--CoA ligase [Luteimonas viscosa]|uniref:Long-chain fatty acid--CoA ligase n=1 Tax=Luteimonas viscosa TaxID=1132694 RepID=A0A5D4XRX9_9GAMM|nr:long-chain fatty acid--CoA ligase [Luteimonas viscosa]TYT27329.1 long-chain fatty acid--CoA ligase [Luteimonas viscosa]
MKPSPHWPPGLPRHLGLPQTSLYENLAISARRYPSRPATLYYGGELTYAQLDAQALALAGFLQQRCGVARGDRVALFMQNCPQFVVALYAILRADAVVVPVNSMNRLEEVRHIVRDSGARTALVAQELAPELLPLKGDLLEHVVVATYSDYIDLGTDLPLPDVVSLPREPIDGAVAWVDTLAENFAPSAHLAGPGDLAMMPYTSGTTGHPKGCLHTHRSVMHTAVAGPEWCFAPKDIVVLANLPMFHVTGLQNGVNTPVYRGNTIVVMTRWDRRCAAMLIERHRAGAWTAIPTMLMDFLAQDLSAHDLSSMHILTGGGAAMPKAVAERIRELWGLDYVEGYGLSETMAPTHLNPVHRPKPQCLGLPIFDTDARVLDPQTLEELPPGEVGEIVTCGPQVMLGYHGRPGDDRETFVEIDGKRFLRTGDLAYVDEEGYFFMVDRLKRMINASGFKIWPAEVEALLYGHPAVQEACVIGTRDPHRGESAKAVVVLREGHDASEADIIEWARGHMAAYKVPHAIEFRTALPRSATGKVQWRALQEAEDGRTS